MKESTSEEEEEASSSRDWKALTTFMTAEMVRVTSAVVADGDMPQFAVQLPQGVVCRMKQTIPDHNETDHKQM
jgi:hypothetical protein